MVPLYIDYGVKWHLRDAASACGVATAGSMTEDWAGGFESTDSDRAGRQSTGNETFHIQVACP